MKVLKNKTYKDLMLKLEKSESDLKKQIEKTDNVQIEFDIYKKSVKDSYIELAEQLEKERVRTSELIVEINKKQDCTIEEQEIFYLKEDKLMLQQQVVELQQKLSRKGLGVKGKKKNNGTFPYDYNTEIHKKA